MTCANYRVKENSIALTGGTREGGEELPFRGGAQLLVRSWALLARVLSRTPLGGDRVLFLRVAWVFAFAARLLF